MSDNFSAARTPVAGLPKQKSFNIDFYSEQEGQHFQGMFIVRRPTILDQARIQAEKSKILGGRYHDSNNPGVGVPEFADNIAEAVGFLRIVIVDAPDWWNDGEVLDPALLFKVYAEAEDLDPFRRTEKPKKPNDDGASRRDSDQKHIDSRPADVLAGLVDEEISETSYQQGMDRQLSGGSHR